MTHPDHGTRIRVLALGDSHFDSRSRFDECIRVHAWLADYIAREHIDVVIHCGDILERRSDPTERDAIAEWLQHVAEHAPVLLVRGNHDVLTDLPLFARLRTKHRVVVEEGVGVHLMTTPGGFVFPIGALAWPERRAMERRWAEWASQVGDRQHDDPSRAALEGLWLALRELANGGTVGCPPALVAAHAMVSGSAAAPTVTGAGQPLVGCDLEIPVDAFSCFDGAPVVLGHVHKAQGWSRPDVFYTGSPRRTAFGETEEKSVLVMTFEAREARDGNAGAIPSWRTLHTERVPTPCVAMWLVEGGPWPSTDPSDPSAGSCALAVREPEGFRARGAEIRLRYTTPADRRTVLRAEAEAWKRDWIAQGAVDVKLEELVIPTSSARAPGVASARTLNEKLRALWSARGERMDDARAERLLRLAHEIETESAA
jgi:DNA repair exonuclease SbcCD nuclease subunit